MKLFDVIKVRRQDGELSVADKLGLPSNATAIRENIVDTFSCDGKVYGYYADVDNECQLFHICYPVQLADGTSTIYKWSFICPAETIFNQVGHPSRKQTSDRIH
jgi:hypothetical protein